MNFPVPVVFIVTVIIALAAGVVSDTQQAIVTVYSGESISAVWREETAPVDRRIALVFDESGRSQLIAEEPFIRTAVNRAAVDFKDEVLFVAAMGTMPTGGYDIRVVSVQAIPERSGGYRLSVRLAAHAPDREEDLVTQAFSYPVDTAVIAHSKWPEGMLTDLREGRVIIEVMDQDGRPWGPAFVYAGDKAADESGDEEEDEQEHEGED